MLPRVIVFEPADAPSVSQRSFRVARTLRAFRGFGAPALDMSDASTASLRDALVATPEPAWLVRAGAWPTARLLATPPSSDSGRPLCGLGRLRAHPGEGESIEAAAWDALLAATGGDLSQAARGPLAVPRLASVFLEQAAIAFLARRLDAGDSLADALFAAVRAREHRVVRVPILDVHDSPRLRVVQVVTTLQQGGAERVALDLTRALRSRGTPTLIVALGQATRQSFEIPTGLVDLSAARGDRAKRAEWIARAALAFGADVLHAHLLDAEDLRMLSRGVGLPIVATVHNARSGWPAGYEALAAGTVSLLVACAKAVERELAAIPVASRTIWNGIDTAPPAPRARAEWRRRLELEDDALVLLSVANPRPQKRLHLLPRIVRATEERLTGRAVRLVVAGAPSRGNAASMAADRELREEVAALGLAAHVRFVGSVGDVAGLYRAADVLVSTSAWEGLSLAQLEAIAAGLPVVATEVGGAREIARSVPSMSLVAPDATPEEFAEAIARCSATATDARLPKDFTLPRMTERHEAIYRAVVSTSQRRPQSGVLLVINNFSTGGAQSSARRLLTGLHAEGVRVRAAVLEERTDHRTPGLRALEAAGVPVLVTPRAGASDPAIAVDRILEAIDEEPPRAVLFWNAIAEHKLLLADALLDIPIYDVSPGEMYFTSLDRYFARPRPGLPYQDAKQFGRRLAGVVVKYRGEAERAARELGAPVHVIANGVPLGERPARRVRSSARLVIGTAARISPQKKLEELLAGLRLAHDRLPPYVLAIAGSVERGAEAYAEELKDAARGLDVEWLGEPPDMRAFLASVDVFAMISEPAGCPNASLEAMAAGLPVIATAIGGASEQVLDGVTGRIVAGADAGALADALLEASRDAEQLADRGGAGRLRAESLFDVRRMIADYRALCGV